MCSIIGYSGSDKAAPVIVQGLKRMEYRGYNSVDCSSNLLAYQDNVWIMN